MIHILLSTDNGFVQHCAVTMASILHHDSDVTFHIFTENLSSQSIAIITDLANSKAGHVKIYTITHDMISDFPMPSFMSSHISVATYFRLFAEKLLSPDVSKIIYLDCDIIVRHSLQGLWNVDVDGFALGAIYQQNEWAIENDSFNRLSIPEEDGYFNAGVLLLNLEYWRSNNVTQRLFDFIRENNSKIHSHDQDVLNAVLWKETKPLANKWNYLPVFLGSQDLYSFPNKIKSITYEFNMADPIVVHYVFKPKPWQYACHHPFKDDYYKYLDETSFKGWRPRFGFKEYLNYIGKSALISTLRKMDIFNIRRFLK